MTKPAIKATTLVTEDGVPIDAVHLPGPGDLGIVVAHGFTLSWQQPAVWRVATRLSRFGGVVSFDFRGHGRSGGASTVGDLEIRDLAVAVAYARELGYTKIATVGFSMGASIVLRHAGLIGGVDAVAAVSGPGRWYTGAPSRCGGCTSPSRTGSAADPAQLLAHPDQRRPVGPGPGAARRGRRPDRAGAPCWWCTATRTQFFPVDHAEQIYAAAREPKDLWIVPRLRARRVRLAEPALVDRIGGWLLARVPPAQSYRRVRRLSSRRERVRVQTWDRVTWIVARPLRPADQRVDVRRAGDLVRRGLAVHGHGERAGAADVEVDVVGVVVQRDGGVRPRRQRLLADRPGAAQRERVVGQGRRDSEGLRARAERAVAARSCRARCRPEVRLRRLVGVGRRGVGDVGRRGQRDARVRRGEQLPDQRLGRG